MPCAQLIPDIARGHRATCVVFVVLRRFRDFFFKYSKKSQKFVQHSKSADELHDIERQPLGMCTRIARQNSPFNHHRINRCNSRDRFHHASSNSVLETVEAVPQYIKDWTHTGLSTGLYLCTLVSRLVFIYLFIFLTNKQHLHYRD